MTKPKETYNDRLARQAANLRPATFFEQICGAWKVEAAFAIITFLAGLAFSQWLLPPLRIFVPALLGIGHG